MTPHVFLKSSAATRQQPTRLYQMSVCRLSPRSPTFSQYSNYQICCLSSLPLSPDQELLKFLGVAMFTPFPDLQSLMCERLRRVNFVRGIGFRRGAGREQPGRPVVNCMISFCVQDLCLMRGLKTYHGKDTAESLLANSGAVSSESILARRSLRGY
jgi:hypothetical protein